MARGGKREGAGRPKGALNKATLDVREAAQAFTEDALTVLASIMKAEEQPAAARVSAAKELLDRGHGKSTQPIAGDPAGEPIRTEARLDVSGLTEDQLRTLAAISTGD
jgi:hypothetical protein